MTKTKAYVIALLILALGATSHSAPNNNSGAFSIPISDTVICGTIALKDRRILRFCSREGVILNLRSNDKEATGIILTRPEAQPLRTDNGDLFSVTVLAISELQDGRSSVAQLAAMPARLKTAVNITLANISLSPAKLTLDRILRGEFGREPANPVALSTSSGSGNGICCVTCPPYTACALQADLGCSKCSASALPK